MNDDLQRNLDQAVEEERKRLAKFERIRSFISGCDKDELELLSSVFRNGVSHDAIEEELPGPGRRVFKVPTITIPDYGPTTDRGTPRQREWGVLFPAVEQAIEAMDEISSTGVYTVLKAAKFRFSTKHPVSSIAAILRTLKSEGRLDLSPTWKKGSRPVFFTKRRSDGAKKHLGSVRARAGSLTAEVKKHISSVSDSFTTGRIVEMLQREGFKFAAKSPTVAVNGVFGRLIRRDEIRIVKKGIGGTGHLYERTAKWNK
jgi:hypothetical protein